jgi:predicted ribosome quality control (RQC) complex YloA/Tae2 family protein
MKYLKKYNESKKEKFPNLKKMEIDGFSVLVGKDAVSNDYLTTIEASENDIWFHVKGIPGSHVLIKIKDTDGVVILPTDEVKKTVAQLAAKNSKAKGDCVVVCCKAKFVKKLPDMNPGQVRVDYKNAEEININI